MIKKIYLFNPYKAARFATNKAIAVRNLAKGKSVHFYSADSEAHYKDLAKNYSNNIFKRISNWFKFFNANRKFQIGEKKGLAIIDEETLPALKKPVSQEEVKFN